ncbi:MAG: calcium/sodium antiporter [Candidatus Electrothrix aestuarii]|uniref:Calcium/sodium antiporter n=1 Tax=Candidatus Electrothrix aestuarii TaxID=3062594 RepID=A0AAU8LRQ0_9BACT|nr:calcium/sodium antiporter [Candidatus Electrothrix aestuarii]
MLIFLFIAGLVLLVVGAEILVKGASRLASALGVSPLVIGLTVVAFATSSPELAVSVKSSFSGQADIALGNVIGSNIMNILFILGLSAIIIPLSVSRQLIRLDVPLLIVLSALILLLSLDGHLGRIDGIILVTGLASYLWFLIHQSRKKKGEMELDGVETAEAGNPQWAKNMALVIGGLVLLVIGSRWLVNSAVSFAEYLKISELIIGLTVVSIGTSLPEAVTSVIAALHGERDMAVGNVVGSNIFNIMGVLGVAAATSPTGIAVSPSVIRFDLPIMITVALACLPIFFTGGVISRKEGFLFFGYYLAYTLYLVLAASGHDALPRFSAIMLYFVLPLTAITLIIVSLQEFRAQKKGVQFWDRT